MSGILAKMRLAAEMWALALTLVPASGFAETTLRFIPQADLRTLDPIWTTAYITRNFGYMVYDTLFALDKDLKPQMVDSWKASDDKLARTFTQREGLKRYDGAPVRAADCAASIERWGKRDPFGQKLLADEIQVEAYTTEIPYVPTGQFVVPTPYRKNIDGIIVAPVPFLWNVEKK